MILSVVMNPSHEIFMRGRSISPDDPCYGYRPIVRCVVRI